jgi:hypothetical protein
MLPDEAGVIPERQGEKFEDHDQQGDIDGHGQCRMGRRQAHRQVSEGRRGRRQDEQESRQAQPVPAANSQ